MLGLILCKVLILGQMMLPTTGAAEPGQVAATQPTTQPTTQPVGWAAASEEFLQQLATGKRQLSLIEVLDPEFWRRLLLELTMQTIALVPRVLVAMLFLVIFWGIYRGIRRLVVGGMAKANVDSSIRDMLGSLIKWAVMGFGLVIAFNQIGIQITALLTGVSIIGLAIGFAAQETLSNFIAGIVIFWDKPFRVGDWISIDGQSGQVKRITFRSTRLLNSDGDMLVMPNTFMLSRRVANHSTNPINRVKVPVSIAYKESIDQAREVLLGLVQGDLRICQSPAPSVGVAACAESSVNLNLSFWIEDEAIRGGIASEYLEKAKKALDQAGIEMPFPHLQVVLEETPAVQMLAGQVGRDN